MGVPQVICVVGPTASGKTALAVSLAELLGGEVVSCDSMQIYRHMNIGTAKPAPAEMRGVVHHMLDVAEPWEEFSVSRFCAMAQPVVDDILTRGKCAILAGGTGLYVDALVRGNGFAPCPSTGMRQALEVRVESEGIEAVLEDLRRVDPEAAQRLHPSDRKRIIRAMEVYLETGQTITAHNRRTAQIPPRYTPLWIGLDYANRKTLYDRIDLRVERMLEAGLLQELQALLDMGIRADCTAMQAIGYKEFTAALAGQCTVEEATALVQQASRRYAKRQLTWFRRNPAVHWLRREDGEAESQIFARARQLVQETDNAAVL